jgi:hypothetical protein
MPARTVVRDLMWQGTNVVYPAAYDTADDAPKDVEKQLEAVATA